MEADASAKNKKKSSWLRVLIFLVPLAALLAIIFAPHSPSHALFRQYFNTIISWPAVVLAIALILLIKYQEAISFCLKKLFIKTPQGYEIRVDQSQASLPENAINMASMSAESEPRLKAVVENAAFMAASEWAIRHMFRSQFRLLKLIEQRGFIDLAEAVEFYNTYLAQGGNQNYKLDQYLGWLSLKNKLIEPKTED